MNKPYSQKAATGPLANHQAVRARNEDPETSHLAAAQVEADQVALALQVTTVVEILKAAGRPMTDFEIAAEWGWRWAGDFSESMPRKARHFARQQGLVRHCGYSQNKGRRVRLYTLGGEALAPAVKCPCCQRYTRAASVMARIAAFTPPPPPPPPPPQPEPEAPQLGFGFGVMP